MAEVLFYPGFDGNTGLTNVYFAVLAGVTVGAWIFEVYVWFDVLQQSGDFP
jgi:hypothetical protein